MFVTVKGDGATVFKQLAFQRREVAERTLRRHKPQFHQHAGRIVNEDEQGTWWAAILKPAMIRPINLDQLAKAFPP